MVTIPLYFSLFIYLLPVAIIFVFIIIDIAHLANTGSLTFTSFLFTCATLICATLILWATSYFLQGTDWRESIRFGNSSANSLIQVDQFST